MIKCNFLESINGVNYCKVVEEINGIKTEVLQEHCDHCANSTMPYSYNKVTVSLAISSAAKVDPEKASKILSQYGEYVRYDPSKDIQCRNRTQSIGKIDCRCQGNNEVYGCKVHELCAIRKLTPGIPTIKLKDLEIKKDIKYCNSCDDLADQASAFTTVEPDYYHSYDDLVTNAKYLASNISKNEQIRGVVGIPRSGMLAASAMAVHLGVPLYYIDRNLNIIAVPYGARLEGSSYTGRLLIVDDSANSGNKLSLLRNKLGDVDYIYSAVYSTERALKVLDYAQIHLELPHWFEWWLYGSPLLYYQKVATDFDGIICEDCPVEMDDDGAKYMQWLMTVKPLRHFYPHGIPYAITARLEKYRDITRWWVNQNRQIIAKIIHAPYKSKEERSLHNISEFKAKSCLSLGVEIFIESEPIQAMEIAAIAKIPVICPKMKKVLNHDKGKYVFK